MDNKNTALQQKVEVMPQQVAAQPGNGQWPLATFPEGPGLCIAGFEKHGVFRILQCENMKERLTHLQARIRSPLVIAAWLPGGRRASKRQGDQLRRLFADKRTDRWFRLSADDLALARAFLVEEKERVAREVDRTRQERQAAKARENATDECLQLIRRILVLAEVVRTFLDQERGMARRTWPQQQATEEYLQLVDGLHAAAGKFDEALSRSAMKIQLARTSKEDAVM